VRTTLTLDDDVAARLAADARRNGQPFKVVVNDCLRAGLAQQRHTEKQAPFQVKPRDFGGLQSGLSLDSISSLLEQVEGPTRR
jgi:hypothetical protein